MLIDWAFNRSVHTPPTAGVFDPVSILPGTPKFWDDRRALDFLSQRKSGAYVRIQGAQDHVQPDFYNNRHAIRAINAAITHVDCAEAVYRTDVYYTPQRVFSNGEPPTLATAPFDESDYSGWPEWVQPEAWDGHNPARVQIARWALDTPFVSGCA